MARRTLYSAALILTLVSGCSGADDEAMSEDDFRAATKVGSFATMSDADVDKITKAYCADLDNIEGDGENSADDLRFVSPIVLAPQAESDAGAVLIAQAFTGRYCVQHAHLFELSPERTEAPDLTERSGELLYCARLGRGEVALSAHGRPLMPAVRATLCS